MCQTGIGGAVVATGLAAALVSALLIAPGAEAADEALAVYEVEGSMSVLVLGSGGPRAESNGRAGSGFLIFIEGEPRIIMDMGGGTLKSLAMSGAEIPNLEHFLITHLHLDHTGDMSAIVKTALFHNRSTGTFRTAPFRFYGPRSNNVPFPDVPPLASGAGVAQYPDVSDYVHGHYDIATGVERYLHAFSLGTDTGRFSYTVDDLPSDYSAAEIDTVFEDPDGLVVRSIAVSHGPVPAVAYRIEYGDYSLVWSGDTRSLTDNMIRLAAGADLLIYDTAIMADDPEPGTIFHQLHTHPERLGEVAASAEPAMLLLSHITSVTEPRIDEVRGIVRAAGYAGAIGIAEDLMVINLASPGGQN
ncbi:MAG: MBL fold metallo-hydrolase [Gammaproteobacteria bacterium]